MTPINLPSTGGLQLYTRRGIYWLERFDKPIDYDAPIVSPFTVLRAPKHFPARIGDLLAAKHLDNLTPAECKQVDRQLDALVKADAARLRRILAGPRAVAA